MNKFILSAALGLAIIALCSACSYGLAGNTSSATVAESSEGQPPSVQPSSPANPSQPQSQPPGQPSSTKEEVGSVSEGAFKPDRGDWRLILVNRKNPLPDDFTVDLVETIGTYKFDSRVSKALKDLMAAAKADGIALSVISTYRRISTQERLYSEKVAEYVNAGLDKSAAEKEAGRWVAYPGTSEHHTGLVVDVVSADWYTYNNDLYDTFENTKEFEWLISHCVEYGFVLRYGKDKQDITGITYEPWHYRYVGIENAEYMTKNNLCLEELWDAMT